MCFMSVSGKPVCKPDRKQKKLKLNVSYSRANTSETRTHFRDPFC